MSEKEIVEEFAQKMFAKIELRHNRYAPLGWQTMDVKRLLFLLKQELKELEESSENTQVSSEAIDVANYAMFIWHKTQS